MVYVQAAVRGRSCWHCRTAIIDLGEAPLMGDPVCWLDQVCEVCGGIGPALDDDRRCQRCSATTGEQPHEGGR